MASFHSLNIKHIRRETSKAVSLTFDVPRDLKQHYIFSAGQYLTLKTTINGNEVRRDYSISSSPSSGDLTVTVKEIPNGLFSGYANSQLKVGDTLDVAPPKGRFVLDSTNNSNTIVGVAAGSGITPIMSILKNVLENNSTQNFFLIYGNKSPEDTIFYKDLLSLKEKYDSRLELQFVFSQSNEDDALFGRIDSGNFQYILKQKIDAFRSSTFFLCGPENMIYSAKEVLIDNNIPQENILFELFKSSSKGSESSPKTSEDSVEVSIVLDDEVENFEMNSNQTILEAAIKHQIEVPYSCQGGVCSSCICRITEGAAEMRQNSILTDTEVAEGLILSCQAVPTSSKIILDFDDI